MKRSHSQCFPRQTLVAYDPLSPSELMRWSAALMCEPRLSQARRKHQQRVKQSANEQMKCLDVSSKAVYELTATPTPTVL